MNDDDLSYEQLHKGKAKKDKLLSQITMNALAPLVLAETLKNSALSRNSSMKDNFKKSTKYYPDSVFDNAVEGIDVVNSHDLKWSSEHPNLAALAGMGVDILDPISYGITKSLSKVPQNVLHKLPYVGGKTLPFSAAGLVQNAADKASDAAVGRVVKRYTKKADMNNVPKLTSYIKEHKLRGKLGKPEHLIERLDGKYDIDGKKVTEGTIDKTGQKITEVLRRADTKGAEKINRGDIFRKMKRAVEAQNADDTVSGITKKEPYLGKLSEVIKPHKREKIIVEGTAPDKPMLAPTIPNGDIEAVISRLEKEAAEMKANKPAQISDPKIDVEGTRAAQSKERVKAEKDIASKNKMSEAENKKTDEELVKYLMQKELKSNPPPLPVEPMDLIHTPKAQKGLPPIPTQEALDIELHNAKAKLANKKYMEQNSPKVDDSLELEERISALENKPRKQMEEVDVPPPMPEDAFNVNPPPIPAEAKGKTLESVLSELADAQAHKKNLNKSNLGIDAENTNSLKNYGLEAKANAPKSKDILVDRISTLEDMHRLKVDARKKLRQSDWDASIKNLPEHKQMVIEATQEIDNNIVEKLKPINLPEGNAAEIYQSLKGDYGTQNDFLEMVIEHTLNEWKGGKSKGGALPALTAGVVAGAASKTLGGSMGLSSIAGATVGEGMRRGVMSSIPEVGAKVMNRFSNPEEAHLLTQLGINTAEGSAKAVGLTPRNDRKIEEVHSDALDFSGVEGVEDNLDFSGVGRKVDSVEQPSETDAIHQKMDETLTPPKPVWDPYINEEVLNTFLPRDSKRIMANPMALMAKIHQVAPNQAAVVQEMLDNDPEGMAEAGPKIAMMFPAMFEKDKYGAFDGKIMDPKMQQKFLSDLSQDEAMSSIEKANMAMKVHRGESINS